MKLEPWHVIVVLVVMTVLFGSRRLPDTARSVGRSMRIFKSEMDGLRGDVRETATTATAHVAPLDGIVVDRSADLADPATSASERRTTQSVP
jgi:sec-independent protein translocase protein TatA